MRPRQPAGAAVLLAAIAAAAILAAGCGAATPTPASGGSAGTPATSAGPAAGATTPAGASQPADRLDAALAAMADSYTYTATVTVGSRAVSTAAGRSVGGASEFVLTTGGSSVTYRAIPPKAWVRQPGKAWVAVSGDVPSGSPLAGLARPASTTAVSDSPDQLVLDAVYPASALGLSGSAPVTVRLTVAGDGAVTAVFQTTVGQDAASSTSVFTPGANLDPIAAP